MPECAECVRLWDEYIGWRKTHAALMRSLDNPAGLDAPARAELVAQAREAFESKERIREELARHKSDGH